MDPRKTTEAKLLGFSGLECLRRSYLVCFGALAQLARVPDWQSGGHRFDSDMLHKGRLFASPFCYMKFYVYILESEVNHSFYIGQTQDLTKRLIYHNNGYSTYTKPYRPWKVFAYLECESRAEAMIMERKIKNLKSKFKVRDFIIKNQFIIS